MLKAISKRFVEPTRILVSDRYARARAYVHGVAAAGGKAIGHGYATSWGLVYRLQYRLSVWRLRRGSRVIFALLIGLAACNIYLLPRIQAALDGLLKDNLIDPLRALLVNLGGPLIGAAAIVTSLVMFAMQINIERMPHGLFRRLSSDPKLLGHRCRLPLNGRGPISLGSNSLSGAVGHIHHPAFVPLRIPACAPPCESNSTVEDSGQ
jgi:hypothetical protein